MWSSTLQINWKQRFFIPTDEEKGLAILTELLTLYPAIGDNDESGDVVIAMPKPDSVYNSAVNQIDIEHWFIDVPDMHAAAEPHASEESIFEPEYEMPQSVTVQQPIAHDGTEERQLDPPESELEAQQIKTPMPPDEIQTAAAGEMPIKAQRTRKPRAVVEEQLAFDFGTL